MTRIRPILEANVDAASKEILGVVRKAMGIAPSFIATMANSLAAFKAYLGSGLSQQETIDARQGKSRSLEERTVLEFARQVVLQQGKIAGLQIAKLTSAYFSEAPNL